MQQQQVSGNYYHHGNVNGAPMGGGGGIPPHGGHPGGGYMPQYAPHPGPGSVDTPSTQMTELITSPAAGNHAPQLNINYTGMISPAAANGHNTGYMGDAVGAMNMGRPHDLPIHGYPAYHHGNPTGEVSQMYLNSDAPVGEQVDTRQPPFTTVGGEDLMCGQGRPRDK